MTEHIITEKEMLRIKQVINHIKNLRLAILAANDTKTNNPNYMLYNFEMIISKKTGEFIAEYLWNLMETLKEIKDI